MVLTEILVPLLNANEPEARIVEIHVRDGQYVETGMVLFTIETTKAASEIEATEAGYVRVLINESSVVAVGERIAVLTEKADEEFRPISANGNQQDSLKPGSPAIRITKPAQSLASTLGIDLAKLPTGQLITEERIRKFHAEQESPTINFPQSEKEQLFIFGGGGHAKTIIDLIRQVGEYSIVGVIDDNPMMSGKGVLGCPVLGTRTILPGIREQGIKLGVNCVGGILDINIRVNIFKLLEELDFKCPSLIHPSAIIEPSASISENVQVLAKAYIGSDSILESSCMINTNSVVSHDCVIGAYTHIAPGVILAGHVQVGEKTLIGMGVTTSIGIKIGSGVRIGNGAILLADVPDKTIIQAGRYWIGRAEEIQR